MNISAPQYFPVTVDLYLPKPQPIVNAQQNDSGRGLQITLTGGGNVLTPGSEVINLYAQKLDGSISYLPCTVSGNYVLCQFTNQMLAVSGNVQIQLEIVFPGDGGATTTLSTTVCTVNVLSSIIDQNAIESSNEFTALEDALAELAYYRENGLKGDPGQAATISIGTVTASDPGSDPEVTNSGTENAAVFNFVLPRGEAGSMWYYGTAITGTETSGTIFLGSGIDSANVMDKYINTETGNIYSCVVAGNAENAQWSYIGNIMGPEGQTQIYFGAYSTFPASGESDKLYVDNTVNPALAYVWNGSGYIPAGGGGTVSAEDVDYDNSTSGLTSTNVQGAIDENAEAIKSLNSKKLNYNNKIKLEENIENYVAPADGYIFTSLIKDGSTVTYYTNVTVNGIIIGVMNGSADKIYVPFSFPVYKDDVIGWQYENPEYCKSTSNYFVPFT